MGVAPLGFYHHVVGVGLDVPTNLLLKNFIHHSS